MKFLLLLLVLFPLNVLALDCIPKTVEYQRMRILVDDVTPFTITHAQFETILTDFRKFWQPYAAKRNATLNMNDLWDDGEINSDAYEQGSQWYIDAYGGLARFPGITPNAYRFVLCHELGHHMGSAPRFNDNTDWASVEGEADYWAAIKCMKTMGIDAVDSALALAKVLARLSGEAHPDRAHRDQTVVDVTEEDHPRAQCRLDTYDAGRACTASGDISRTDAKSGACYVYPKGKAGVGDRPLCWYKP